MQIQVSGHQVDTGEALRQHVEDRMSALADKYFPETISGQATFGRAPHDAFSCDIVTHVMQGLWLKANDKAQDAHHAFEGALTKIEKQLRRYMRRINDRHSQAAHALKEEEAAYTVFDSEDESPEASDAPPIIAELRANIPEVSVSDAVMVLNMRNTPALLFKNSGTGSHNMVYRRDDGTIGWVEPQSAS